MSEEKHPLITLEQAYKQIAKPLPAPGTDVPASMLPFVLKSMPKNDPRYQRIIQAQVNGEELDINKVLKGEIE